MQNKTSSKQLLPPPQGIENYVFVEDVVPPKSATPTKFWTWVTQKGSPKD